MNLFLALPTAGTPAEPFVAALKALRMPATLHGFESLTIRGNFIPGQRELAVRRALRTNADYLAMIDDDMELPTDALCRLIEALEAQPELALAGALYYSRDGIHPMVADRWLSSDTTTASIPAYTDELIFCDAVGFGCVVIRLAAIRTLTAPYFSTQILVEDAAARVRLCNEDYLFCEDIRRAGWRVGMHAGVRCKHYDRRSGRSMPTEWEPADQTAFERMLIVESGPRYRAIRYDSAQPTIREQHLAARLDYILVEEL